MKIAVCDDSRDERAQLILMLRAFFEERDPRAEFFEFESGEALLSGFSPGAFDLIFLDIYMERLSGVETGRGLRAADPNCAIIFTTASREHGADAFDLEAFHYLVKPVEREKLFSVMNKWYGACWDMRTLLLRRGAASREILVRDILYITVLGRNSTVRTSAESFETSASLSTLAKLLPEGEFIRPIRYCLAAFQHIQAVQDDAIRMDNGEKLPLSRLERENLRQCLASYRLRKLRGR